MSKDTNARIQPVQQTSGALSVSPATTGVGAPTNSVPRAAPLAPSLAQLSCAIVSGSDELPAPGSCQQQLRISLFFDGTGNNLNADVFTLEHSNVARLFRAHQVDSDITNTFRRYIPGIGTRFPQIGDNGNGPIKWVDLSSGLGLVGQQRLDWAFTEVGSIVANAKARAGNPSNEMRGIRFAIFGFSRGATLAHAFVRDLVGEKCNAVGKRLTWRDGGYPVRIGFLGLWDTVASVGLPMSANNKFAFRKRSTVQANGKPGAVTTLCASDLAFGPPGADPSPGYADGHGAWANGLEIPAAVERCVQMVAAHEIRNSFPVDSVSRDNVKPGNCVEWVYPGMHSDVGGGYRPGEGGLGKAVREQLVREQKTSDVLDADLSLGQIPLIAMFNAAQEAGVSFRAIGSADWAEQNNFDFKVSPYLCDLFNKYMKRAGSCGRPIGTEMLAHTRLHLAWRLRRIHRLQLAAAAAFEAMLPRFGTASGAVGGSGVLRSDASPDAVRNAQIAGNEKVFTQDADMLQQQRDRRARELSAERASERRAEQPYDDTISMQSVRDAPDFAAITKAQQQRDALRAASAPRQQALEEQIGQLDARLKTLPSRGKLSAATAEYDRQLLADAQSILAQIAVRPSLRERLRPHYRNVVETYEDEFVHGRGLGQTQGDEAVIVFFDNYVHDSLSDFDHNDVTLPSDPRMVYVGGDMKLMYALEEAPLGAETAVG